MMVGEPRPYASRLAIRFVIILAIALLPAGVVAFVQTNALEEEIQARTEAALMGATFRGAVAETEVIRRVRGMTASLASAVPYVIDDPQACNALMRSVAVEEQTASLVAFVPPSGLMTCSSTGRTFDFSDNPLFQRIFQSREPLFVVNPKGPISGTSVLGIVHPAFDDQGNYLGYAVMSLPHAALTNLRLEATAANGPIADPVEAAFVFWTFDRDGTLLTSNINLEDVKKHLPSAQSLKDFVGSKGQVFRERSPDGQTMTYAIVPIVAGELYIMSSFSSDVPIFSNTFGLTAYLPTLLMWLAGLVAAGFAAEMLVTRHIRKLNRAMVSFARGDRRLQTLELKGAPAELEELGTAYLAMTDSITRSEAELEDSVHQKEVLLREVHHRVKNNLQLISSIMNIQTRSARSGEAKDLLKNLQERIMSLATVHRGLYQTSGLADVRARELIPDIVRQIMSMSSGPEKPFETQSDIDDLRLVPDQAVPLSLLLAEALTNAIKHGGATREYPGRLTVRLKRSGGSEAVLEVANSLGLRDENAPMRAASDTGIGSQLITAFVQQLGGRQESGEVDGTYFLKVMFGVSPLALAENRQVPQNSDATEWNTSTM
jgi:two-component system, sensor histidine kinase PdtaS